MQKVDVEMLKQELDGQMMKDGSITADKLATASDADKIKLGNLATEVLQSMSGTAATDATNAANNANNAAAAAIEAANQLDDATQAALTAAATTQLIWKDPVDTFAQIATTYPNPQEGWAVPVRQGSKIYRREGGQWKERIDLSYDMLEILSELVDTSDINGGMFGESVTGTYINGGTF